MAKTAELPRNLSAPPERRRHPRKKIYEVTYFDLLDRQNGGLVLNISETGLLLQSALKVTGDEVSRLRFRLPASDQWIEARARLVWFGKSGKEVGAQFLDLSEDARAGIKEWMAIGSPPGSTAGMTDARTVSQRAAQAPSSPADSAPDVAAPGSVPIQPPQTDSEKQKDWPPPSFAPPRPEASLPWSGLAKVLSLIAIVLAAVFFGPGYYRRLLHLPMLAKLEQTWNHAVTRAKAVESPPANAVKRSAAAPPQTQSPVLPPNSPEGGAAPAPSIASQPAPVRATPEGTKSSLSSTLTQTLPPGSTAGESSASEIRSQAQTRRHASVARPSETAFPTPAGASASSHDAILVGAPPVGAPSARVLLESEPVSASSFVAITERRSILVPGSYDRTEQLQLGKLISHVDPAYPDAALAREIDGTVRVRAFIGLSGQVLSVRLLSGPAALAPAAISAIRQWRYSPTLLNGQAIESQADITVFFRLH